MTGGMPGGGWTLRRLQAARSSLVKFGLVQQLRPATHRKPAMWRFADFRPPSLRGSKQRDVYFSLVSVFAYPTWAIGQFRMPRRVFQERRIGSGDGYVQPHGIPCRSYMSASLAIQNGIGRSPRSNRITWTASWVLYPEYPRARPKDAAVKFSAFRMALSCVPFIKSLALNSPAATILQP